MEFPSLHSLFVRKLTLTSRRVVHECTPRHANNLNNFRNKNYSNSLGGIISDFFVALFFLIFNLKCRKRWANPVGVSLK